MAHPTHDQIDAIATQTDSAPESPEQETTLAYGAQGECVTKLVNLLALLGYDTNDVHNGAPPVLNESVLVDVRAAQAALEVQEPELLTPAEIPVGVKGEIVSQATWNALYAAAESKLASAAATKPASESE